MTRRKGERKKREVIPRFEHRWHVRGGGFTIWIEALLVEEVHAILSVQRVLYGSKSIFLKKRSQLYDKLVSPSQTQHQNK